MISTVVVPGPRSTVVPPTLPLGPKRTVPCVSCCGQSCRPQIRYGVSAELADAGPTTATRPPVHVFHLAAPTCCFWCSCAAWREQVVETLPRTCRPLPYDLRRGRFGCIRAGSGVDLRASHRATTARAGGHARVGGPGARAAAVRLLHDLTVSPRVPPAPRRSTRPSEPRRWCRTTAAATGRERPSTVSGARFLLAHQRNLAHVQPWERRDHPDPEGRGGRHQRVKRGAGPAPGRRSAEISVVARNPRVSIGIGVPPPSTAEKGTPCANKWSP